MRLVLYRGKWAVYHPDGRRHSLHTADRIIADRKFQEYKRQATSKRETIGEILEAYLKEKKDKPSIAGMRDAANAAKPFFGHLRPNNLSRDLCRDYTVRRINAGVSAGTIRKELGVIRQAIRYFDPAAAPQIELPPSPPPKERHLSRAEFNSLLDKCVHKHLKLFCQIAIGTGARKGAILDLTWNQVDFDRGIITLSKGVETNKRRAVVKMNEQLKTTLQDAKKGSASEYIVSYAGNRVGSINKGFREACERAGLVGVSPHTLRHTAAVWQAEAGIPMDQISQFLGHTNPAITARVYARYSPDYLKGAAEALTY